MLRISNRYQMSQNKFEESKLVLHFLCFFYMSMIRLQYICLLHWQELLYLIAYVVFPWVQERMLRWFPPFQVASTCFSWSPPDLNSVVTNCLLSYYVKWPLPPGDNPTAVNKYYYYYYIIFVTLYKLQIMHILYFVTFTIYAHFSL